MSVPLVLKPGMVSEAIKGLDGPDATFSGYLAALSSTTRPARKEAFGTDEIRAFFDRFLAVPGGPMKEDKARPYFVPWGRTHSGGWFNPNIAGSYAPSSLPEGRPFRKVIDVRGDGRDRRYFLKKDHAKLAKEHLLANSPVSSLKLGAFLFRNFGFEESEANPSGVRQALADLLHLTVGDAEYKLLFTDNDTEFLTDAAWIPFQQPE